MMPLDEKDLQLLAEVLPNVSAQLRSSMANVFAAANRLAPAEAREADPMLDKNAAILTMSCHQMLRLVGNLSAASELVQGGRFRLCNDDIVGFCHALCERAVKCGERHVQLTVADTGRGIEPERLAHIFERYLDTDRLDPAPPHGLGVGLSLCRRIAQGHGGMLVAESAVGKGTAFTLSLPNARSTDLSLSDRRFDYAGGFDHVLMELSDALPSRAFLQKYLD